MSRTDWRTNVLKAEVIHASLVRTTYLALKIYQYFIFFSPKKEETVRFCSTKRHFQENRMLLSWQDLLLPEPWPEHIYQVLFFSWRYVSLPAKLISAMWSPCCYEFIAKVNQSVLKRREIEVQNAHYPQRETSQFCNPSKSVLNSTTLIYHFQFFKKCLPRHLHDFLVLDTIWIKDASY